MQSWVDTILEDWVSPIISYQKTKFVEVYSLKQLKSMLERGTDKRKYKTRFQNPYQKAFSSGISNSNIPAKKFIACMYFSKKKNLMTEYDDDDNNEDYHQWID